MLIVRAASRRYGDDPALERLDLEFQNGVYGLLAPNGAGKTTLLKMLAGLLPPSEGEILYDGEPLADLDEKYRMKLGYLPQRFGYYPGDTPLKYMQYLAAIKGMNRKEASERSELLLDAVALGEAKRRKMKTFSGGMIQRVGIAQALLNDPRVLILDEPTAGLDPKERGRFRSLLTQLGRDRIVILSTHVVSDVESAANEIILLKDGRVFAKDKPEGICLMLAGRVYETKIGDAEADAFRERYAILAERGEPDGWRMRFVSEAESALPQWQAVQPTLEDVFLYVYRDAEGRAPERMLFPREPAGSGKRGESV
ncbi:ATP-binding cassette domain-containing protein [Saccharibacillus alkalitolerans]|uniref:ATP-binding cassette domain-containing protein n=1 Tax=Saccharibacillus alkalitolerans TaxID=2705290 RepID=A0ABX0F1V1_9BACL|nr:ATP-binding cassette domain-containing protein [Saccharibacillus alkalitolerans]NGZ74019.1 ATP-binding cassette domain-containing protein [Saccharibacillus alkalitolerans]